MEWTDLPEHIGVQTTSRGPGRQSRKPPQSVCKTGAYTPLPDSPILHQGAIMKSLAILSLSLIATAAMAGPMGGGGGGGSGGGSSSSQIEINGPSVQVTLLNRSGVLNVATGGGKASQNLASNAGNVTIDRSGSSLQVVAATGSGILNKADGYSAVAVNNL